MPIKIRARDFAERKDLDHYVSATYGDAGDPDVTIEGTEAELKALQLRDERRVFGIKCVATDVTQAQKRADKKAKIDQRNVEFNGNFNRRKQ